MHHGLHMNLNLKQAQLAGDGTYPWGEKFHDKKGLKITIQGKMMKGLKFQMLKMG